MHDLITLIHQIVNNYKYNEKKEELSFLDIQ